MKLNSLKKIYLNTKILNYIEQKKIIFFIQYNNILPKNHFLFIKELSKHNFNLKLLKNKSNFLVKQNPKIHFFGCSCMIFSNNQKLISLKTLLEIVNLLKKYQLLLISLKYNNKIYNISNLKNIKKFKNDKNLIFNFILNLKKIQSLNKNIKVT